MSRSKIDAIGHLAAAGLPRPNTLAVPVSEVAARRQEIEDFIVASGFIVARTSGLAHVLNLPRLLSRSPEEVLRWSSDLAAEVTHLILTAYEEISWSAEMMWTPELVEAELIPGIWELDARSTVAWFRSNVITGQCAAALPTVPQASKFFSPERGTYWQPARVTSLDMARLSEWCEAQADRLEHLANALDGSIHLKLHCGARVSVQNVRPTRGDVRDPISSDGLVGEIPVLRSIADTASSSDVLVELAVAREDSALLVEFLRKLRESGVRRVHLRSGLLSHFAILCREAGLQTVRAAL